jgi:Insertion element 4 transposase N-terminal
MPSLSLVASSRLVTWGLTQYLPFGLVDDVLEQARTVRRRLRVLPSRAGVYFVLALGMPACAGGLPAGDASRPASGPGGSFPGPGLPRGKAAM